MQGDYEAGLGHLLRAQAPARLSLALFPQLLPRSISSMSRLWCVCGQRTHRSRALVVVRECVCGGGEVESVAGLDGAVGWAIRPPIHRRTHNPLNQPPFLCSGWLGDPSCAHTTHSISLPFLCSGGLGDPSPHSPAHTQPTQSASPFYVAVGWAIRPLLHLRTHIPLNQPPLSMQPCRGGPPGDSAPATAFRSRPCTYSPTPH